MFTLPCPTSWQTEQLAEMPQSLSSPAAAHYTSAKQLNSQRAPLFVVWQPTTAPKRKQVTMHTGRRPYRSGRPSHQMVALWCNKLHDRNSMRHVIVFQIAQQCIWRRHYSVADVWMKLSLVQELNVIDTFGWIIRNVFCSPVEIASWTKPAIILIYHL